MPRKRARALGPAESGVDEPTGSLVARYRAGERNFTGEDHAGVRAEDRKLEFAVLARCDLSESSLVAANLQGADLEGATLTNADLTDADFTGAKLRGACLSGGLLRRAILAKADLRGALLDDADLRETDLSYACLGGAVLDGADLRNADLDGADLRKSRLEGTQLSGAKATSQTQWPDEFDVTTAGVRIHVAEDARSPAQHAQSNSNMPNSQAEPSRHKKVTTIPGATCARCASPMVQKHVLKDEAVCTTCMLHDHGARVPGDIQAALEWMDERGICAYCGEHGTVREAIAGGVIGATLRVLSCNECADLARAHHFSDFAAKKTFLRKALAERYAHSVNAREWDARELAELEPTLRASAEVYDKQGRIVRGRLDFDFAKLVRAN